ncbi:GGDEF domain-containing protein [Paracidovorax citrulli]|uniref:diguanylate cyclase n=2 Tax=Paracidovorax citrulli TaxID=80869 RepID=A1TRA6_PARC0|nr:GGDEF domain-containing protein [Paracidovorax citrulli]ABM33494.1 diguanylate cyclase [Paracidovorax citrulli AAC00-1]ATG94121.1 GGDEF domain-containing protein [Paracidovorax citrulli]PVY67524.1 diguanylate cyclase [Paracidovorax citrulli]QCX12769.1 Diguanylate cyclase VdcA [Paracidovorax citrulli]REG68317.1 diguanylate cyclase [Paracidovorax citrulli]
MDAMATPPDLFESENRALLSARAAYEACHTPGHGEGCRQALGDLLAAYERLLRETRRLVRRSDRAELEMNQLNQQLTELAEQLHYRATHDPLTGVLNRAAIIEQVNGRFETGSVALIVLDIDHFKKVNDSFGHPVGDSVIRGVVDRLKSVVPGSAQIGRVGGEEFTVLLPEEDAMACERVAEAARRAIEGFDFGLPDGSRVTASFGVSWLPGGCVFDDAYGLADEALYGAKRAGRNRVVRAAPAAHAPNP